MSGNKKNGKMPDIISIGEFCKRMFTKEGYEEIEQSPLADDFDIKFDLNEFRVCGIMPSMSDEDDEIKGYCLAYVGDETDGSKIHIPDGIKHCDYMFSNYWRHVKALETPPVIPDSVETCDGMFHMCSFLREPAIIPDSVKSCNRMYAHCTRLESLPDVPDSVVNRDDMFLDCGCAVTENRKSAEPVRRGEDIGISEETVESGVEY